MTKLKDTDIRFVLLNNLYDKYSDDNTTRIVNEMGVMHGQSRVDVAVINGVLHGYEIKSESDNLNRLPSQISDYNLVFERMTIVVQRNYLEEVRQMIPKWWGIILVTKQKNNVNLKVLRKGKTNPNLDPFALSSLLWKEEALDILKKRGLQKGFVSKPRKFIYQKMSESFSVDEIKYLVNEQLKSREDWKCLELQ
ncbi:sce7726 family protein [Lysinibacillus xylanilyticus]|uniref:sce7726 family protein n=1 Tax=Lysinibacillus xylanilyticus TaxID=582475 RepID=UPI0037F4F149